MYLDIVMTPVVQSEADVYFMSSQNESLACQKRMWLCFRKNVFITCVSNNAPVPLKGLRTPEERQERLRGIPTAYNYRLESPLRNLRTHADARQLYPKELEAFVSNYQPLKKAQGKLRIDTLN